MPGTTSCQASSPAILLVNISVALQLAALAQHHRREQQEDGIKPDKSECDSKISVEERVGIVADGSDAAAELGGDDCIRTSLVQDERGRGVAVVAAAGELEDS